MYQVYRKLIWLPLATISNRGWAAVRNWSTLVYYFYLIGRIIRIF
jgi:hypothetical protein